MWGSPVFVLRQKVILKKLQECGALSEESAKTLEEAGVFHPSAFPKITEDLAGNRIGPQGQTRLPPAGR